MATACEICQGTGLVKKKKLGVVCVHYGVEVEKGKAGDKFLDWIGGYFEAYWSVNPHWTAEFDELPKHPITRGVKPFKLNDEWYYHMRFRPKMAGVTPILSALPPDDTLKLRDGSHSGNPHVRRAIKNGEKQHVAWASENPNGGRGFGITAEGWVDFEKKILHLSGAVAPARSIRRVLGKIPLVKQILMGPRNEGICATLYSVSGPFDDIDVSANPLSTITPGITREIFKLLPGEHQPSDE